MNKNGLIYNFNIKNKLVAIMLLVTFISIIIGFVFVAIWDINRIKKEISSNLILNTQLIGSNCIVPLTFNDDIQATNVISEIKYIEDMECAYLYDKGGNLFAIYPETNCIDATPKLMGNLNLQIKDRYYFVEEPIRFADDLYGTLIIKANSDQLNGVKKELIVTLSIVLVASLLISFFVALKMQNIISEPILILTKHIKKVSLLKCHYPEIKKIYNDEIGALFDDVNQLYKKVYQREAELVASELKYSDLYEYSPEMLLSVDAETGKIIQVNNTLATRTGYKKEELIGYLIFDMYHPDSVENAKKAFLQFKSGQEVENYELQIKKKDGSIIDILLNTTAIKNENGIIVASRTSWRDISERKKAEKELAVYKTNLELLVKKRTRELELKNKELENMNEVFVGREYRIKELKSLIAELKKNNVN